jgi:uncharacterized protein
MGLIRFLFFLLIASVVWFMVKNYLRKQELRERKEQGRVAGARIVRCKQCDVHLPEQDALREGDDWFCTPAHKAAWLAKTPKS